MAPEHLLQRIGYLADRGLGAGCRNGAFEQVAGPCLRASRQRVKGALHRGLVALGLEPGKLLELLTAHGAVVDLEDADVGVFSGPILVDADNGLAAGVDAS